MSESSELMISCAVPSCRRCEAMREVKSKGAGFLEPAGRTRTEMGFGGESKQSYCGEKGGRGTKTMQKAKASVARGERERGSAGVSDGGWRRERLCACACAWLCSLLHSSWVGTGDGRRRHRQRQRQRHATVLVYSSIDVCTLRAQWRWAAGGGAGGNEQAHTRRARGS